MLPPAATELNSYLQCLLAHFLWAMHDILMSCKSNQICVAAPLLHQHLTRLTTWSKSVQCNFREMTRNDNRKSHEIIQTADISHGQPGARRDDQPPLGRQPTAAACGTGTAPAAARHGGSSHRHAGVQTLLPGHYYLTW